MLKGALLLFVLLAFVVIAGYWVLDRAYSNRIYPNVVVGDVSVGSLTRQQAVAKVSQRLESYLNQPLVLTFDQTSWRPSASDIGVRVEVERSVDRAFAERNHENIARSFVSTLMNNSHPVTIPLDVTIEPNQLNQYLSSIGDEVNRTAITPNLTVEGTNVQLKGGGKGYTFLQPETRARVVRALRTLHPHTVALQVYTTEGVVSSSQISEARREAQQIVSGPLLLEANGQRWEIKPDTLSKWVRTGVAQEQGTDKADLRVSLDSTKVKKYLSRIAREVDRDPQNAKLQWVDGNIQVVSPGQQGQQIDVAKATGVIEQKAKSSDRIIQLPLTTEPPAIDGSNVQSLGITQLLGKGDSGFQGSMPERVNNIHIASTKITGEVVQPGDTFSFNEMLGDVSSKAGFQQELIGDNKLGYQGPMTGISQVSTTLFRAIWNTGLPILERHASPYRIGYYEQLNQQAGYDAVVDPSKSEDFKFKNSTDHAILIQILVGPDSMRVEIYGGDPGWQVKTSAPTMNNASQPYGGDIYWVDPLLKNGESQLYIPSADGMDVTIARQVVRDGNVISEDHLLSQYEPIANVYARGTG